MKIKSLLTNGRKKIEETSKYLYSSKVQLLFILLCIFLSRLLIYEFFEYWASINQSDIGFWDALSKYDTSWYKTIIEEGYFKQPLLGDHQDAANWAFFPLYPLLMKISHYILPINYDILAFIINSIFLLLAMFFAIKYILLTRGDIVQAYVFVILMTFGVYNFYFSILYTESLFIFFVITFFYCLKCKKYLWMGIIGALASATRNMGVMLVFPVIVQFIEDYFKTNKFSIKGFFINLFNNHKFILGIMMIPAGLFSYMLYLYLWVGDSMAFVHIQRAWGRGDISNPLRVLLNSLTNVNSFVFYLSIWSLWGIYCLWLLFNNKRWSELIMAVLFVFIPLSTSVDSMPRYLIGCFLPLLAFTDGLSKHPVYKTFALIVVSFIFGLICLNGWFNYEAFVM